MQRPNKDDFAGFHPFISFVYFAFVFAFTMIYMHPVCLLISLVCGAAYLILQRGAKALGYVFRFALPMMLLAAIVNPAFSHEGMTILTYLPTGNPLTLESILYGLAAGAMLASVLIWFECFSSVMTSDKFVYLFGRIIPALSLVLSMTLRFVPKFKKEFAEVKEAQEGLGHSMNRGGLINKVKVAFACFSIMITRSLENSIETASSMKSRGYGLKGRTSFSIYRFDTRDVVSLILFSLLGIGIIVGGAFKGLYFRYYPAVKGTLSSPLSAALFAAYLLLFSAPVIINIKGNIQWNSLHSKITALHIPSQNQEH